MEHVWAAYIKQAKEFSYKRYMADVTRMIGENIATLCHGSYVSSRWMEPKEADEEQLDGDAIAADIINRAGLVFKEQENESV